MWWESKAQPRPADAPDFSSHHNSGSSLAFALCFCHTISIGRDTLFCKSGLPTPSCSNSGDDLGNDCTFLYPAFWDGLQTACAQEHSLGILKIILQDFGAWQPQTHHSYGAVHSDSAPHQLENGHTWTEFGTFNFQILTSLDKISQDLKSYLQVSFLSSLLSFYLPVWTSKHNSLIFPHPGTGLVASLRNVIFWDLYSLSLNSLRLWEMFPPVILAALSAAYGPSFLDLRPWNFFPHFFILLFCAYLPRP